MLCDNCKVEMAPGYRDNVAKTLPGLKPSQYAGLAMFATYLGIANAFFLTVNACCWLDHNAGEARVNAAKADRHYADWESTLNFRQKQIDEDEKVLAEKLRQESVREEIRKFSQEELQRRAAGDVK